MQAITAFLCTYFHENNPLEDCRLAGDLLLGDFATRAPAETGQQITAPSGRRTQFQDRTLGAKNRRVRPQSENQRSTRPVGLDATSTRVGASAVWMQRTCPRRPGMHGPTGA